MGSKIFCPACGAENKEGFTYCVRCGARLSVNVGFEAGDGYSQNSAQDSYYAQTPPPSGSPTELDETAAFVGNGNYVYAAKLQRMKNTGKKSSWNWPVFLFGIFLGMPFVWFFYRKMKKQGWINLGVCAALSLCVMVCAYGIIRPVADYTGSALLSPGGGSDNHISVDYGSQSGAVDYDDDEFEAAMGEAINRLMPRLIAWLAVGAVLSVGRLVYIILLAVYADDMYQKHGNRKIEELKTRGVYDIRAIRLAGGTSPGAAVLSGVLFNIASSVISMVFAFNAVWRIVSLVALM